MDVRKITVAVCGDSFCAASTVDLQVTGTGRRAHFSQMLEDHYGYNVLHYAHGGFSNFAILFQIREAINAGADVVVYNKTWSSRLEIYRDDRFFGETGLRNFHYYDSNHQSTQSSPVGDCFASVLSTTHHNIGNSPNFKVTDEQKKAVDLYLKHLYNDNAKTLADSWMFSYWHDQIVKAGILPVRFEDNNIGKIAYDFSLANPSFDTPFHTDRATQEQIAANIHKYIVDNLQQKQ